MIDFHCHILDGIDDGSRDVNMSSEIYSISMNQGVTYIVCTPHFYAWKDSVDDFLKKREEAYYRLIQATAELDGPVLLKGAEVMYFEGMARSDRIKDLTIEGTRILLVEMPFEPWRQSFVDEIEHLCRRNYIIIIAHLERFMNRKNKKYVDQLIDMTYDLPVYVQINAETLIDRKTRNKFIKMFRAGDAHFLGRDCHSLNSRPQNYIYGRQVLVDKLGEAFVQVMDQRGLELIER